MHKALVREYLKLVRQRHAEGDCPITPSLPTETLEFMVLALDSDLSAGEREWRSIESAPRDGTIIDVWFAENLDREDQDFYCSPGTRRSADWHWKDGKWCPATGLPTGLVTFVQPTHWMLPPAAPRQEKL